MADKSLTLDDLEAFKSELALHPDYLKAMGWFQTAWAGVEVNTDFAICSLLKIPHEQGHLITAGMTFGPKANLLVALPKNSDHPKKEAISSAFSKVTNQNYRNVFAHGYIATDKDTVTFIFRQKGAAKPKTHRFTMDEFVAHVVKFVQAGEDFSDVLDDALKRAPDALDAFAHAAWEPEDE
jgi:hypothetical protein